MLSEVDSFCKKWFKLPAPQEVTEAVALGHINHLPKTSVFEIIRYVESYITKLPPPINTLSEKI